MEDVELDVGSYSLNELFDFVGVTPADTQAVAHLAYGRKKTAIRGLVDHGAEAKAALLEFLEAAYRVVRPALRETVAESTLDPGIVQLVNQRNECNYRLNPITPDTIKQVISVDSVFRDNYNASTTSDFVFTLPNEINNVIAMKLTAAEVPMTNYLFCAKKNNNHFIVRIKDTGTLVETDHEVVIPDGIWYSADIVLYIQNYFDNDNTTDTRYLIFAIDEQGGRAFLRFKTPAEITALDPGLDVNRPQSLEYKLLLDGTRSLAEELHYSDSALYIIGFRPAQLYGWTTYATTYTYGRLTYNGFLTGYFIYGHNIPTYFYIYINDFVTNTKEQIMAFKKGGTVSDNILGRLQVTNPGFTVNITNSGDKIFKERNYFGNVKLRKLEIKILDRMGNVIDLNNSDVSLALELTQSYCSERQQRFNKVLNADII